jgi:hypothetical protein
MTLDTMGFIKKRDIRKTFGKFVLITRPGEYFEKLNQEIEYFPKSMSVEVLKMREYIHMMHKKELLHKIRYFELLKFFPIMKKFRKKYIFASTNPMMFI